MIGVVDYGIGNLGSLFNMFDFLGFEVKTVSSPETLSECSKIVLPGVGSFDAALMAISKKSGLKEALEDMALRRRVPFLGVCLGMQLMTDGSEEGNLGGFGWIEGECFWLQSSPGNRVPHVGWNTLSSLKASPILEGVSLNDKFYFVHSYGVQVKHEVHSGAKTLHGGSFDSVIQKENLFGVQFHPEKSHKFGMKVLRNFGKL